MKVKEESEKTGLKLNIQKTKIMASGPTTSWQIDGETMETVTDFIFLGANITADGDCSHKIKRCLLLGSPDSHFAFCISFPWGWSLSLSPVQCHEPHSIVHQALYLSDLGP